MNANDRVRNSVRDARSNDDLVDEGFFFQDDSGESPLDRETLDERASTQMGEMWEPRRRDAN